MPYTIIVLLIVALLAAMLCWSCCQVSSWQSRREDARDGEAGE